jgi:hypothetical protein
MRNGKPFPGYWTMDYPRSDRHLMAGIRRLTRIETRSVEQVVSLDGTGEVYNWPTLYAVEVGHWRLPDDQAANSASFSCAAASSWWTISTAPRSGIPSSPKVCTRFFPTGPSWRSPIAIPSFTLSTIWTNGFKCPAHSISRAERRTRQDGYQPRWRAIYDDKGRVMVAICHNMDLGDAWEWSDDARYYEKWASLAYRIAVDYFVYDLTH